MLFRSLYNLRQEDGGGVAREKKVCKECGSDGVKDIEHWLLRCAAQRAIASKSAGTKRRWL